MRLDAKRILVPVNGTPYSEQILRWGCQMARESKAALHAIYVIEVPLALSLEAEIGEEIDRGERILSRMEAISSQEKYKGLQARSMRARQAGPAIAAEAENRDINLVLIGVPYKRSFNSSMLGSTASYVFNNASCQVMFWRESAPGLLLPRD